MIDRVVEIASHAVSMLPKDIRGTEYKVIYRSLTKARDEMIAEGTPDTYILKILNIMGGQFHPFIGQPSPAEVTRKK